MHSIEVVGSSLGGLPMAAVDHLSRRVTNILGIILIVVLTFVKYEI
jgi:hypothetical protein